MEFHWTRPEYETEGMFTIILYRKSSAAAPPELTDLEKRVVDLMSADHKPSMDELCQMVGRKKSTTYNLLKGLRERGYLR